MNENFILSILPVLAIGLIGLLIGGLVGALAAGGFQSGSTRRERNPGKNFSRIFSIWRDKKNGKLVVEIESNYFPTARQMTAKRQTSVKLLLDEIHSWLGVQPSDAQSIEEKRPAGQDVSNIIGSPDLPIQSHINEKMKPPAIATPEVKPASVEIRDIFTRTINPVARKASPEPAGTGSIAAQVDEILQERLAVSSFKHRSIHVLDNNVTGIVVEVDGQTFAGVGEVPDPDVRKLIQDCVAEWEKRI